MILQEFVFQILPSFELMLEILNIMLVCKFEINWSTNTNLRALTIYPDGWTDARHFHIPRSAFCGGQKKRQFKKNLNAVSVHGTLTEYLLRQMI